MLDLDTERLAKAIDDQKNGIKLITLYKIDCGTSYHAYFLQVDLNIYKNLADPLRILPPGVNSQEMWIRALYHNFVDCSVVFSADGRGDSFVSDRRRRRTFKYTDYSDEEALAKDIVDHASNVLKNHSSVASNKLVNNIQKRIDKAIIKSLTAAAKISKNI